MQVIYTSELVHILLKMHQKKRSHSFVYINNTSKLSMYKFLWNVDNKHLLGTVACTTLMRLLSRFQTLKVLLPYWLDTRDWRLRILNHFRNPVNMNYSHVLLFLEIPLTFNQFSTRWIHIRSCTNLLEGRPLQAW